ncbi:hypothetical protein FHS29_007360 [Saccharothrix tamanrassetensis]|uniref:Uncharacterized protein n=1 Tax=Saccharothrix tamanrassetensis TaxID=1051531 RepID=A0A841CQN4_9PSEU|nr:hypothetical protein [Saccharothrix tamanrassetensis]MBB5960732.1 hypothetical protein [Saccharothrix tamanrassetensis]
MSTDITGVTLPARDGRDVLLARTQAAARDGSTTLGTALGRSAPHFLPTFLEFAYAGAVPAKVLSAHAATWPTGTRRTRRKSSSAHCACTGSGPVRPRTRACPKTSAGR